LEGIGLGITVPEFNSVLVVFLFGRKKWLKGICVYSLRCLPKNGCRVGYRRHRYNVPRGSPYRPDAQKRWLPELSQDGPLKSV